MSALTTTSRDLPTLATEINAEHAAAERAINDSLNHARRCGELLIEAKRQCTHGEWGGWLAANFQASDRTARGYMVLARRWNDLPVQNGNALPIRDALAFLAEPREPAPIPQEPPARHAPERLDSEPSPDPSTVCEHNVSMADDCTACDALDEPIHPSEWATEDDVRRAGEAALLTEYEEEVAERKSEVAPAADPTTYEPVSPADVTTGTRTPRAVIHHTPYSARMKALIAAAVDASGATDDEVAAVPANDMMIQSLRSARDVLDRIIAHHTKERKHG
jgi:hypothetical protein